MKRVAIIQYEIHDYRVAFYRQLRDALSESGIELDLYASYPVGKTYLKSSIDELEFATVLNRKSLWGFGEWQGAPGRFADYDLVILQQALKAYSNYLIFASRLLRRRPARVALWGHGQNMQADTEAWLSKTVRNLMIGRSDHCFAYTELSRRIFLERGAAPDRISVVNNSKDIRHISRARADAGLDGDGLPATRSGATRNPTAVFCSRLTEGKKIPFLVDAFRLARENVPGLKLVVIGDGPLRGWLEGVARSESWIDMRGALYGDEMARQLVSSDFFVMPGHMGLSIIDAFAAGLPVLSTDFENHSPEIEYLENGINGLVSHRQPTDFADAIRQVATNGALRRKLGIAALDTAKTYSLDAMVENLAAGIHTCLARR